MTLPNNEYSFHVKIQGEKTKEWFEGDFTFKCILNIEEQMEVGLRTDRYNGGSKTLSSDFSLFNRMIAELEVRIVKTKEGKFQAPTWWIESNGGWKLHDANVVMEVFNTIAKAEQSWKDRLAQKAEEAEKAAEVKPARRKASESHAASE